MALSSIFLFVVMGMQIFPYSWQYSPQTLLTSSSRLTMASNLDEFIVLKGVIQRGFGRGGRMLGFPTANLPQFDAELQSNNIPMGVYCGLAKLETYPSPYLCISNIGLSPTFVGEENKRLVIESHLPEFDDVKDLYGCKLTLCLAVYMRPETKFESLSDLVRQINSDISQAKEWRNVNHKYERMKHILEEVSRNGDGVFKLF